MYTAWRDDGKALAAAAAEGRLEPRRGYYAPSIVDYNTAFAATAWPKREETR